MTSGFQGRLEAGATRRHQIRDTGVSSARDIDVGVADDRRCIHDEGVGDGVVRLPVFEKHEPQLLRDQALTAAYADPLS
jgi:hypothetical protein